jgi:molybdopterin synthase sulfur carrier subunit
MRVSFFATLRKIVGSKHVELDLPDPVRLRDVLAAVLDSYPDLGDELVDETGSLSRHVHLFVDGRSSKWLADGMDSKVDGSQSVEFFPAVAGG